MIFCTACKAKKPYATWGWHCTIEHNEKYSQDLLDDEHVATPTEKRPERKKKADPKRAMSNRPVRTASEKSDKGPKPKKTKLSDGKVAIP